jgi:hypothetical protein
LLRLGSRVPFFLSTRLESREIFILSLALFGIATGIRSALLATRLIASMLFGLSPGDSADGHRRLPVASPE